jgi:hypothetical protein
MLANFFWKQRTDASVWKVPIATRGGFRGIAALRSLPLAGLENRIVQVPVVAGTRLRRIRQAGFLRCRVEGDASHFHEERPCGVRAAKIRSLLRARQVFIRLNPDRVLLKQSTDTSFTEARLLVAVPQFLPIP